MVDLRPQDPQLTQHLALVRNKYLLLKEEENGDQYFQSMATGGVGVHGDHVQAQAPSLVQGLKFWLLMVDVKLQDPQLTQHLALVRNKSLLLKEELETIIFSQWLLGELGFMGIMFKQRHQVSFEV